MMDVFAIGQETEEKQVKDGLVRVFQCDAGLVFLNLGCIVA